MNINFLAKDSREAHFRSLGIASDLIPVVPSDTTDLPKPAMSLFVETGGTLTFISAAGTQRTVTVPDNFTLLVGVRRVLTSGTLASGIHAFVFV